MDFGQMLSSIPPALVYAVVALVIGVESIGVPLPGETMLVAASLLAAHPQSTLNPWLIASFAALGAIIGDSIGYTVGRKFGGRLLGWLSDKFPHHISKAHIRYAEHVFSKWGTWTVFFGRFIALLRILAGPLAGTLKVDYPRFLLANASGGIVWSFGTVWVIYLLGSSAHHWLQEGGWIALAIVFLACLTGYLLFRHRLRAEVKKFERPEDFQPQES